MVTPAFSNIFIIGLGTSGLSCARYFASLGQAFTMLDTRSSPPQLATFQAEFPHAPVLLGPLDSCCLQLNSLIVVSPGVDCRTSFFDHAQAQDIPIWGDVELFAQTTTSSIIAITGTNGKSTVTSLVGHLLASVGMSVAVGGNIGTPVLDLLTQPTPAWTVLELSSFQLESTYSLKNHLACVLNLSDDHLDRHGDMANYARSKQRIYQNCRYAVFNAEDPLTLPQHCPAIGSSSFTTQIPAPLQFGLKSTPDDAWLAWGDTALISTAQLPLAGRHNHANYLAALSLALAAGAPLRALLHGLQSYQSLAHRCEWVDTINDVRWFNDSKGTNVGATLAALLGLGQTIAGKIIWLAGGQDKGQDFSPLAPACTQFVRHTILFGEDADKISASLGDYCPMQTVADLEMAVQRAAELALPGDIVLLSPACASFDMFKNFEDRGNQFKQLIKEWIS